MKDRSLRAALLAAVAVVLAAAPGAQAGQGHGDVVFVQTNEPTGNQIVVYDTGRDGGLTPAWMYATGGNGGAALPGTESDHLGSQGSLVYDPGHKVLLAVNAGS